MGIVAAMTIPTLLSDYRKSEVEKQVIKFYSTMTEAIKLSEIDNGSISNWSITTAEDFFNKYLKNYLRVTKAFEPDKYIGNSNYSSYFVVFPNGTGMEIAQLSDVSVHIAFYINSNLFINDKDRILGKDYFDFLLNPNGKDTQAANMCPGSSRFLNKGFDAYYWWYNVEYDSEKNCNKSVIPENDNDLREELLNAETYGCANGGTYCTMLLKMNNWKIPDDYPIKF